MGHSSSCSGAASGEAQLSRNDKHDLQWDAWHGFVLIPDIFALLVEDNPLPSLKEIGICYLCGCLPAFLSPRLRLFPFEWGSPGLTDLSLLQHLHNSFATLDAIHSVFSKLAQSFSIWVLAAEKIVLVKSNISKHLQTKSVPLKQKTKQWISLLCPH